MTGPPGDDGTKGGPGNPGGPGDKVRLYKKFCAIKYL